MQRFILAAAAAAFFVGISSAPSLAHIALQQREATAGTYKAVLGVPHGCDGEPTISLRVEIPEGFVGAQPMPKPGWDIKIEKGDYAQVYHLHSEEVGSGPVAVTWSGGNLPDEYYDEFTLRGTLAGVRDGQRLFFKTVQTCSSGKQQAWIEEPAAGQDAHALKHPAPFLVIRAANGSAHDHEAGQASVGALHITGAWARAMLPGQPTGGGYLSITNNGAEADRLVTASSPIAGKVEIHSMEMSGNIMKMRPVEGGLEIPPGAAVTLEPGGEHLMFMQVESPFREGDSVPLTLEFEKAGKVEIMLPVRAANTGHAH